MKTYGEVHVQFHAFLTLTLIEISGQLHTPATSPSGKELLIPIGQEAGWAPEPVWTQW